ncbi:MAG: neutral zinc metallopeptidase [Arcanobacterium sp.]|nr:neutral zinc metallopeptidase [Arcanobacterium sp.]
MTFNDNITLDTGGTRRGPRGRGAAVGGLGGVGVVGAIIYFLITGQMPDLGMLTGETQTQSQQSQNENAVPLEQECRTGADANRNPNCRLIAGKNSLDVFWEEQLPAETGVRYSAPQMTLFSGSTATACGTGTSQMGPFYCPGDNGVYFDVTFFDQLNQIGAENNAITQLYILAHEYGHHIQNQTGILQQVDHRSSGPNSSMVRSELQADCLAGVWIHHASNTIDEDTGVAYLKAPTNQQLREALNAAAAVGDDRITENAGMRANPDNFSHGSAEKRMEWLNRGIQGGTIATCDTWNVATP